MAEAVMQERRRRERRHLVERRLPQERRTATDRRRRERRSVRLKIARRDRRRALNRRIAERRRLSDRRAAQNRRSLLRARYTPTPYTTEQIARVRRIFASHEPAFLCPSCNGTFTLGRGRRRGEEKLRRVQCLRCGKSAVVTGNWRLRILVITEKANVRDSIREALSEVGHEVVDSADAAVGLWAYEQNPCDVVFVDVITAGRMQAGEFIRQIKKYSADACVIAVSGRTSYSGRDPLNIARELGATRTIRAPFSQKQLLEVLAATQHT